MTNKFRQSLAGDGKDAPDASPDPQASQPGEAKKPFHDRIPTWVWVVGGIMWLCWKVQPSPAEEAAKHEKGLHCVSSYDGAHPALVEAVKENLRDPESFELVSTRLTPKLPDGTHKLLMTYRARNGFGGKTVETASARFSNADCSIISWDSN